MRALAALLLAMASACRHARPETDTRVPDVTDFCCTAADCCGVRYFDEDGGVHVQPCGPRMVGGHVPPEALSAWLLPEVGGSEELADATPRDALARGEHPPQAAGEFVVRCEEAYMPPVEPWQTI
jgi:hypothetical protein